MGFVPFAISWNITSFCNLACRHCYIDADSRGAGDLTRDEMMKIVSDIAKLNPGTVLILTGGEPLAHKDIFDLCSKASSLGLMVVLGTNGTLLTEGTCKKLKESGVAGVGVSIDSLDEKVHDPFRGSPGALKASIQGLVNARNAGIEIQVQMTPIKSNLHEIPKIAEWAHGIGAHAFNIFFLVCTGRGQAMTDISPLEYEEVLKWAESVQDKFEGMLVRPKCAPHFKRVLFEKDGNHPLLSTYISACRAGTQYMRIDPKGRVTPCPYMEVPAGDLRKAGLQEVWNNSPVFKKYREPVYEGKCGLCRFRLLCGGCRARAYANGKGEMGEDAYCAYEPKGQEEAVENIDTASKYGAGTEITLKWTKEAEELIAKIPFFARSIVRLAVERHSRGKGIETITVETIKSCAPSGRFKRPISK